MKTVRWMKIIGVFLITLGLLRPIISLAQSGPPPLPPIPTDPYLDSWSFYDPTNWFSDLGYAPIGFTNIICDQSCWASDDGVIDCNGLILDSTDPAFLNYKVVESDGNTNLICSAGTIWFWFSPDWGSTNLGDGSIGPGVWGRFVDVGAWTSNADYGWWSLYTDPAGDNIYFSGQTNGAGTNYLNYPISWTAGSWHLIGLTYTATNSILYVDGQLATNGIGVSYWPGHDVLTNGFWIGSDFSGIEQARGEFVDVEAWANQYRSNYFSDYYNQMLPEISGTSGFFGGGGGGGDFMPPFGGGGGGGGGTNDEYGTNLWLYIDGVSNNLAGTFLMNTEPDVLYEIQSTTNLAQLPMGWNSEGFVYGSEITNFVELDVEQSNRPDLFMRIRSWVDSNDSGIPDWWWLTYFGQTTNVDAFAADPAGDGYDNLQKFQMGLNPTNYYNPNAPAGFFGCMDSAQTNVFLEWSPSPGPVVNYVIQRGIADTNGNYIYSQIGLVSSNTTYFEDVGAITNDNAWNNIYNLEAVYPGGTVTATDTWYAYYDEFGPESFPPYGAPTPNDFYAYATPTGTNVLLSWTATTSAGAAPTNYIIERGVYDTTNFDYDYVQIAAVSTNTTTFQDVGVLSNTNAWSDSYAVVAVFPGGAMSQPATATISTNQPPPTGVSAVLDSTGTNVLISWTPPQNGSPTNYIIERGIYNPSTFDYTYSPIGSVSGSTTSFEDLGAITGNNSYNNSYEVEAVYPGGNDSQFDYSYLPGPPSSSTFNDNIYITAYLIRNGTGRWQVMFSGFPTNSARAIQLTWTDPNNNVTTQTISTTNLINGIYPIADTNVVNLLGDSLAAQLFGSNGEPGQVAQAGVLANDAPYFVDGRQHMKQNLKFMIRGASDAQPFFASEFFVFGGFGLFYDQYAADMNQGATNFEQASFLHHGSFDGGEDLSGYTLDNLWPFTINYDLANYFVDTTRTNSWPYGSTNFTFSPNFATNVPAPPMLTHADPYWILQPGFYANIATPSYDTGSNWNVSVTSTQTVASLASSGNNLFGLPYETGCIVDMNNYYYSLDSGSLYQSLAPGGSVTASSGYNIGDYANWCPAPTLQLVNYYSVVLANPSDNPMGLPGAYKSFYNNTVPNNRGVQPFTPLEDDFNITNQTPPLIVGTVGQPMILASWAKFSVSNSVPTKYAYLGQYFATNAFLLNSSGTATTNSAGILSPYGEFFPTQAGQAALVTMPDIDTGQQGTNVVRIVAMNVDANHDGTMDFSFLGPDQTSSSRPFRFWVNDDTDWSDDTGNGIPGQAAQADGVQQIQVQTETSYLGFQSVWEVHGRRDLVDFFPVYLNIGSLFQSNVLSSGISINDTNYQFVLSQADGALRFAYTDLTPTNYMNFLRDTNESGSLAYAPLTTITASGVTLTNIFLSGIATNNQGIILVEAASSTTQPLVLTIYHGTNLIAQTSLYLSMSGVEQMFRSKTMLLYSQSGTVPDRLTDASVPNEPDTTDKNFIFLHGYNVNPNQARGWNADIYKRLYWSGSHAKFYGVTWSASDSQQFNQVTINLQTNIVHAFNTAPLLNTFLNSLSGTNIVAAHSLGNMVVLSTLNDYTNQSINTYFMIDAAVAIEAVDSGAPSNPDMYPTAWTNYEGSLWASDWYALFPTNDYRSTLTWRGRLDNLQNANVYNFYSSGEEVLRDYPADPPDSLLGLLVGQGIGVYEGATGVDTWAWQEKLKGLMLANGILSSDHGGWQFNEAYETNIVVGGSSYWEPMSPAAAAGLTATQLQTNAFFNFASGSIFSFTNDLALESSSGSSYAQANRNRILSDAIPCLTLPVGANPVPSFDSDHNINMQNNENNWPLGRLQQPEGNNWHHSDIRAVAYTFTYEVFNAIVNDGNLK